MTIILASKSPRRRALLARITRNFVVVPSDADEIQTGPPCERAVGSARAKARAVRAHAEGLLLGADTIVVVGEHVLGKPQSQREAEGMLRALSGRSHRVMTGLHLWNTELDIVREACVETDVRFRDVSDDEIARYLATQEYVDKAGAYAIQGRAAAFVESIVGEYTNVMGLPLCELSRLLREMGVAL
jgi:septum formation protein